VAAVTAKATFKVTHPEAAFRVADPGIGDRADAIAREAAARTPHGDTGALAAGWTVQPRETGSRLVTNPVAYARFVEYGTRNRPAVPMLGPVLAAHRAAGGG
jgi:hypothetical protein